MSLTERALKRRKVRSDQSPENYMDLRFIIPTSNICERFLSVAGNALTDRRQSMLPVNFENQMFLHSNAHLWRLEEVNDVMNDVDNSE